MRLYAGENGSGDEGMMDKWKSAPVSRQQSINHNQLTSYRSKIAVLVFLSAGNFAVAICSSLQAPFFPREAELKGATPAQYGLVFGVFELTSCLVAPFFGKFMAVVTPTFLLNSSMFIVGTCSVIFGFLDQAPSGSTFLTLALLIRIMEGVGSAGYRTSSFALVADQFPDNMAMYFGIMETAMGIGLIIGPTVGGALYQVGGFMLPFVTAGCVLIVIEVVTFFLIPRSDYTNQSKPGSVLRFICNPTKLLDGAVLLGIGICTGFNHVGLEPHLRQFSMSPVAVGSMFIIAGSIYAVSSPLWGRLLDLKVHPKLLVSLGCLSVSICFFLIGPASFLPIETELWLVSLSLMFFGFGASGSTLSVFLDCLKDSLKRGFPDDVSTYGLVAGLLNSCYSLGYFVGPTTGGYMIQALGFRVGSVVVSGILLLLTLVFLSLFAWERFHLTSVDVATDPDAALLRKKYQRFYYQTISKSDTKQETKDLPVV